MGVGNDEVLLFHRLAAMRRENSRRLDRDDRETHTKLDRKYQKHFDRIVRQEQEEYLDQSDIEIF